MNLPFPMILVENCLTERDFNRLLEEFPDESEVRNFNKVAGGRYRLSSDEMGFYRFLGRRNGWRRFYNFVNSSEFVRNVFELFDKELGQAGWPVRKGTSVDLYHLKRLARKRSEPAGAKKWKRIERTVKRWWRKSTVKGSDSEVFVHMDISAAYDGYSRRIHIDKGTRVVAFIVYLSDAYETGGKGGEFCINRYDEEEETFEEVYRIRPRKNLMIMFVSTPDSYHSVPKVEGATSPRRFVYGAITAKRAVDWSRREARNVESR